MLSLSQCLLWTIWADLSIGPQILCRLASPSYSSLRPNAVYIIHSTSGQAEIGQDHLWMRQSFTEQAGKFTYTLDDMNCQSYCCVLKLPSRYHEMSCPFCLPLTAQQDEPEASVSLTTFQSKALSVALIQKPF